MWQLGEGSGQRAEGRAEGEDEGRVEGAGVESRVYPGVDVRASEGEIGHVVLSCCVIDRHVP
jgi:hypothetical protein